MSDRYEVVLSFFLRSDVPEPVLAASRGHLCLSPDYPAGLDEEEHPWPQPAGRGRHGNAAHIGDAG